MAVSAESDALETRLSEIQSALRNRRLEDTEKLRIFLSDSDIAAVANVISGGTRAAKFLLIATAKKVVWSSTWSYVNKAINTPSGRPPDYQLFAITLECCEFWQKSENRTKLGGDFTVSVPMGRET